MTTTGNFGMTHEEINDLRKYFDTIVQRVFDAIKEGNDDRAALRTDVNVMNTKMDTLHREHTELKGTITQQGEALRRHMDREDGIRTKVMAWLIAGLLSAVITLGAYIWTIEVARHTGI